MLYNPAAPKSKEETVKKWKYPMKVYARWMRYKQNILLKLKKKSS
jgi:hypothetical protein